jgi:magnesium transporter
MSTPSNHTKKVYDPALGAGDFRFLYFSQLLKKPVCAGKIKDRLGKISDLVFVNKEPYPEAAGIYLEYGWGKPTQFVPWDHVLRIEDDAIFVKPPDEGERYKPFADQPGWILLDKHLIGRTILDMDGRRIEVVNDVHLLEAKGRLLLVHVDSSFNGLLRRWRLGSHLIKDNLISWKYVQPLSVEDAIVTDKVSLSVTRRQLKELPSEDLADALEQLRGEEQEALFSALDSEKAAETLMEAEPRAQRQLIANLRQERARQILSEMSIPQLANLFSVLPHDNMTELHELLPLDRAQRITEILSEREAQAGNIMNQEFVAFQKEASVGEVLQNLRSSQRDYKNISYIYVVATEENILQGVVDLRQLVLAQDKQTLGDLMTSPVVSAEVDDTQDDLVEMFAKYHYRMVPVVDSRDRIRGVIRHNDVMKT